MHQAAGAGRIDVHCVQKGGSLCLLLTWARTPVTARRPDKARLPVLREALAAPVMISEVP